MQKDSTLKWLKYLYKDGVTDIDALKGLQMRMLRQLLSNIQTFLGELSH